MAEILDGTNVSEEIIHELKEYFSDKKTKLATILVGNNYSSEVYVNMKKRKCEELGIDFELIRFTENAGEEAVINKINSLNLDSNVKGILVQLPLPKMMNTKKILNSINPKKDIDGLTAENLGLLIMGEERIISCTAKGIIRLMEKYNISLKGKKAVIINNSFLVGRPLCQLLLNKGATVTICHELTKNLKEHTLSADIVISAAGIPFLIKEDMIKSGSVIIDVGITKKEGKLTGDVDFDRAKNRCSYITPVPGGVGPMTIAMLIENLRIINERTP
jgi:methylenetetrahydrofolate dehydrogenase (NADP+) / methenyltetrahydrofolate cyclohydrolase